MHRFRSRALLRPPLSLRLSLARARQTRRAGSSNPRFQSRNGRNSVQWTELSQKKKPLFLAPLPSSDRNRNGRVDTLRGRRVRTPAISIDRPPAAPERELAQLDARHPLARSKYRASRDRSWRTKGGSGQALRSIAL